MFRVAATWGDDSTSLPYCGTGDKLCLDCSLVGLILEIQDKLLEKDIDIFAEWRM